MSASRADLATPTIMQPSPDNRRIMDASTTSPSTESSMEANMGHYASPIDTSTRSRSYGSNLRNSLLGSSVEPIRTSSISKAYAATLSKLGIKQRTHTNGSEDKFSSNVREGGLKTRRVFKRKSLASIPPPHCERKQFGDGTVVHMIGGVNPPRVLSQSGISEMGFQTSPSLQSRSVNKDFKEPTRSPPNSESKGPSTSFPEGDPDVSVGPQLPRSLVPHLSLMGAEMFDISPETDDSVVYFTPPMRPSLESPDLESSFAKETPYVSPLLSSLPLQPTQAPVVSPSSTSPEPQFQEVIESEPIQTVEMSLDMGVDASADVDAYLKEFSSDMEKISLVSVDTLNGVRYRESDEHRESTYEDFNQPTDTSSYDVQSTVELTQLVRSISSTSLLAPLTQADFDASFEQIFRVTYPEDDPVLAATTHLGRYMAYRRNEKLTPRGKGKGNARSMNDDSRSLRVPELRIVPATP